MGGRQSKLIHFGLRTVASKGIHKQIKKRRFAAFNTQSPEHTSETRGKRGSLIRIYHEAYGMSI